MFPDAAADADAAGADDDGAALIADDVAEGAGAVVAGALDPSSDGFEHAAVAAAITATSARLGRESVLWPVVRPVARVAIGSYALARKITSSVMVDSLADGEALEHARSARAGVAKCDYVRAAEWFRDRASFYFSGLEWP